MTGHHELATQYILSLLPLDHQDLHVFSVKVEWRGHDRYAVTRMSECLSADGTWHYEPRSSDREDDWLGEHRFDLETALELARVWLPHVGVNGWTAQDVVDREGGQS